MSKSFIRLGALTVSLLFANTIWADTVVQVITPAAQSPNSTIDWTQLGSDQTLLGSSANATSTTGLGTAVAFTGPNSVVSVVCTTAPPMATTNCSWTGSGFPKGDHVLWASDAANGGNGPITLTFSSGVLGVGALVQTDLPGQFTASIEVFNGSTSLGSFTAVSNAAGDATYVGVMDQSGANITSVVFSLTACPGNCADFALDTVNLNTPTVTKTLQTITFGALANKVLGSGTFMVSATASSGLTVSFDSQTTPLVCSVSGSTVTLLATGTCSIQATQLGNTTFAAAPPVIQSFQVTPITQTITFGPLPTKALGSAPFGVSATASSGLTVSFGSLTTSVCTVSGTTVTLVAGGTCTIEASQLGNASYAAATPVDQSFTVTSTLTTQTITFGALPSKVLGSGTFTVSATASSGLAVSFASNSGAICTVSGSTVTLLQAGTCTIEATQKGNTTYAAATPVDQSFQVTLPALTSQTITFPALPDQPLSAAPFQISATATSGLPVSFSATDETVCTVSGTLDTQGLVLSPATVTLVGVGTCTIQATQGGSDTFDAAPVVIRSFLVTAVATDAFLIRYAANLNIGDAYVDITNSGASGGNICANIYTFDPGEELISCCTCSVTPNALQSLSVLNSLTSKPLTPDVPTAVVIKLVATSGTCNAAVVTPSNLAPGMLAWGTSLHAGATSPVSYAVTETPFSVAKLTAAELAHITSTCGFIQANGSGFGICKGCAGGGLGAATQNQ